MGLIHIYCGEGKGKTTAAMGLALRGAGAGFRVHIVQLLKGSDTSELASLKLIPRITVSRVDQNYGFSFNMSNEDKKRITDCHNRLLENAFDKMICGEIDMLIIDEFFAAYNKELLNRELAQKIVFEKNKDCELILTGRYPDNEFIRAADYVSEINAVKHPYRCGITARKGIEY